MDGTYSGPFSRGEVTEEAEQWSIRAYNQTMNIVAATWADCAEINDLLSLCELNTGCASDLISDCLILRSGRLLVGAVQVQCIGSAALGCWLAVRPGFRRQGWGKKLGDAALAHCRDAGVHSLFVYTETAPFYFRSLGFRSAEVSEVPVAITALLCERLSGQNIKADELLMLPIRPSTAQSATFGECKIPSSILS